MVVGTPIRVAQASSGRSRMVLGLKPLGSGGLSWPDQDDFGFGQGEENFNDTGWIWPTKGIFTSGYGWRWGRMHKGIDIANNVGTPIQAAKDGVVVFSGWSSGYGYLVELSHGDGTSTRYAHNGRLIVRKGQVIPQGATISLSSLGPMGGVTSTPVIAPPQVAIIAVNKMQELPVIEDGELVAKKKMNLSLSCDHRVVDGWDAASFLQEMKKFIENPIRLLSA